jgi:hypothetical protein
VERALMLESPAKINLFLEVLERRPDGYHEIDTLFQTVSLSDTLEVEVAPGRPGIEVEWSGRGSFDPEVRLGAFQGSDASGDLLEARGIDSQSLGLRLSGAPGPTRIGVFSELRSTAHLIGGPVERLAGTERDEQQRREARERQDREPSEPKKLR